MICQVLYEILHITNRNCLGYCNIGEGLKGVQYKIPGQMGMGHSFINNLEWRRAEGHFGDGEVETEDIIKAITNAPSSFGIQPYKIYAITNKELKERLKAASYGQPQVSECHTLFVFCSRTDVEARAEQYIKDANAERMRDMLIGSIKGMKDVGEWAARQAYIALGFGLAACAENRIASCS